MNSSDPTAYLSIRPKTRLLLNALRDHPAEIVSKKELVAAVWGHEHVDESALFQLVRDLRNAMGTAECVRTYPGRGYVWEGEHLLRTSAGRGWWRGARRWLHRGNALRVSSVVTASTLLVAAFTLWITGPDSMAGDASLQLPRSDMMRGIYQSQAQGQSAHALKRIDSLLDYYPDFPPAHLERSRLLHADGEMGLALQAAHDALSSARASSDPYSETDALLLLTQMAIEQGQWDRARRLNLESLERAGTHALACEAKLAGELNGWIASQNPVEDQADTSRQIETDQRALIARCIDQSPTGQPA